MVDGWTDDGPWLYYKLTNEPKGSDELKKVYLVEGHSRNISVKVFVKKSAMR